MISVLKIVYENIKEYVHMNIVKLRCGQEGHFAMMAHKRIEKYLVFFNYFSHAYVQINKSIS